MPDIVGFADYLHDSDFVCDMWSDELADPDPVSLFPYPKTGGGLRHLAVVTLRDHVRLRVAAGVVATATDRKLANTVYSARLGPKPPAWGFKGNPYRKFRYGAARDCRRWNCDGMVRTDVRSYYPTIPLDRLVEAVFQAQPDGRAAAFVLTALLRWEDRDGLRGLPIGPDACGVLGTYYLSPVDATMGQLFASFHRNTDDIIYFYSDNAVRNAGLPDLRHAMKELGLDLAVEKTLVVDNPVDGLEAIRRGALEYLESGLHYGPPGDISKVLRYWDKRLESGELDTIDLRWCLGTLRWQSHPHAVDALATRPDLIRRDPRAAANYLSGCGRTSPTAIDALLEGAVDPNGDSPSRLHGLRFLSGVELNREAGRRLLDLARDTTAALPLRTWAWAAYGSSKAMDVSDVGDSVDVETQPEACRAAVLTLHRAEGRRGANYVARHAVRRFPELRPAARWAVDISAA